MNNKNIKSEVKHGVEPRPVQDRNSGQGQVERAIMYVHGTNLRLYFRKDRIAYYDIHSYFRENKDAMKRVQKLERAVRTRDKELLIEVLSHCVKNKRAISYLKRAKKFKTLKKYFDAAESILNEINRSLLAEKYIRLQYHINTNKLYVMINRVDNLIVASKEYTVTQDDFNKFIRTLKVNFISLKDNVLSVNFMLHIRTDFYLQHRNNAIEAFFDKIFKTTERKYESMLL